MALESETATKAMAIHTSSNADFISAKKKKATRVVLNNLRTFQMHPAQTKYSIILTRQKIANSAKQSLDLSVDGMQLTKVESERVLGVYIDSHLTWNEHIDTLRRKLLQRIAILERARKYIPTKYRLLLYKYPTALYLFLFKNAALD